MFIIFPVLRLVTLGDLRQRCLTHEDVEVENQQNEGKAANAGLGDNFNETLTVCTRVNSRKNLKRIMVRDGICG